MLNYFVSEIEITRKYENYGLEVVFGKDRMSMIKNYQKGYFLDLSSLSTVLGVSMSKLLEDLSYNSAIRGHFAHYRNEGRIIKVIDIECLNSMIRSLASSNGYPIELLKSVHSEINKIKEQMEKEVNQ